MGEHRFNPKSMTSRNLKIDPTSLKPLLCTCGQGVFFDAKELKIVSALQSPAGQPGFIESITGKICAACGKGYSTQELLKMALEPSKEVKLDG